jgi:hypothetical protein
MKIHKKRMMADIKEPFVVMILGIRINSLWKVHLWLPVFFSMKKIFKELYSHPEHGFIGHESWFGNPWLSIQYWRSIDDIIAYAGNKDAIHLPTWVKYNKTQSKRAAVGLWHEIYLAQPGTFDVAYKNMPPFALGRATGVTLYHGPLIKSDAGFDLD